LRKNILQYYILSVAYILFMSSLSPAQSENHFEILKYEIDEVKIEFKGSKSFDTDDIIKIIKSGSEEYFDRSEFILDAERIEKFYFDNGFLDAFVDTSLTFDHNNLDVIVDIYYS